MPQAKFSKQYDYQRKFGETMTSYPKGYEGDVPQAHYDAAVEAGAIEGATKVDAAATSGRAKPSENSASK